MADNEAGNWCLIESDPGVFTELISGLGVKGTQVEELYSIDDEKFLSNYKPIYGLIFLFKWRPGEELEGVSLPDAPVYFAQQVITNACASQALINLLLNVSSSDVQLGSILGSFKSFTAGFDPATRGLTLSNSEEIRKLHNSFTREHYMELDIPKAKSEDNFHFIAYVPVEGKIYELDGMREAPIWLADVELEKDWVDTLRPFIQRRIQKYTSGEIHFNLMALVPNLKNKYENRVAELSTTGMDSDEVAKELNELHLLISDEEDKFRNYKIENNRRRHNYMPFLVELLKCLAREGKLVPFVTEALQRKKIEEAKKSSA
uniref:Ubiquitin carboxyl-terminal hydrolase n=1 Tax=Globodera rostochiensis TaxID=31243 RepID=A0A914H2E9_GLORO